MDSVYLDNHSATKPLASLLEQIPALQGQCWASSSAPHLLGQQQYLPLTTSINKIYDNVGAAAEDQLFFFANTAESTQQIFLHAYAQFLRESGKTHILSTHVEEAPILLSLKKMEKLGCTGKLTAVSSRGQLTAELLEEAIRPRTGLVSLSWANGLTGVIHPLQDIAEVCKQKRVLLHVDASYILGRQFFRFQDLHVDFLTFDGAFFHAMKGAAAAITKPKSLMPPMMMGHSSDNVAGIVCLAEALEHAIEQFEHVCMETARLRDKLQEGLVQGGIGAHVFYKDSERLPNTSAIAFPGVSNESLLYRLNALGIYATMGGGHFQKLSHLLVSSGIEESLAHSALSFSLSYETTEAEIDYVVDAIIRSVTDLKTLSSHLQ